MHAFSRRKRYFLRQHLEVGRIGEVDERQVAEEAVGGEDVEEVLALRVGGPVGEHEVDVEVDVAPAEPRAAGQPQVGARGDGLVSTVAAGVVVHHADIALVDVLGGEEEAVVVGPHGALQLAPVARHLDDAGAVVGPGRPAVGAVGVDLVAAGERGAPAVVVEGAGEMVGAGGAVALRPVVGVVEVQLRLVAAEAAVLGAVDGRVVVDAGEDRLAVAPLDQERRHAAAREPAGAVAPHAFGFWSGKLGWNLVPGAHCAHDMA